MMPVPPVHSTQNIKLMAVVNRLQQIMINENLTPDELVGCAGVVRIITANTAISAIRKLRRFGHQI